MTKTVWTDLAELDGAPKAHTDEFGPEVAHALAQLRSVNGLSAEAELPQRLRGDADHFRSELKSALPGVNRRGFLQLTGAAAVFAMAGCWHKDPDVLVPYAQQPEGSILGKPVYYSTVVRDSGRPVPVMVKTYDGRPIKIEGNPDSPVNNGSRVRGVCDLATQAALLNLYDPDRQIRGPLKKSDGALTEVTWESVDKDVAALLATGRIALITGPVDGPAQRAVIDGVQKAFGNRLAHAAYSAFTSEVAVEARRWSFGAAAAKPPVYHLDRADVLLTLGSDFLGGGQTGLADQVAFGDFRRLRGEGASADLGQVIAIEPTMSQTGSVADIRVRASMDQIERLAWGLARALGATVPAALEPKDGNQLGLRAIEDKDAIIWIAERLQAVKAAGRNSLVYVGGATHMGERSKSLHVAANMINALLGNEGVTVETASVGESMIWADATATTAVLNQVGAGGDNTIDVVILAGANPAYSLPGAAAALARAKAVIVLADRVDESFAAAKTAYLAPSLHSLESWGDSEPVADCYALQQPVIRPLWDCRAAEESLMAFTVATLGDQAPAMFRTEIAPADKTQKTVCSRQVLWQAQAYGVRPFADLIQHVWTETVQKRSGALASGIEFWTASRATGVVARPLVASTAPTFNEVVLQSLKPTVVTGTYQLVISASRTLGDGTHANNAWLQEVPDAVSRITWDNYLAVSPQDAAHFGADRQTYATGYQNPVVDLTINGTVVRLPVHMQEGQHPGTLEVFLGWGRQDIGKVAAGSGPDQDGGFNAFLAAGPTRNFWGIAVESVLTGDRYRLACTQGHNTMDGRDIVIDDALELFRKDPGKKNRGHHHALWKDGTSGDGSVNLSMWGSTHIYPGRRWGMTVDLNQCNGCHACLVACTAENNVPVVGRDEVRKGREMHWIRIDRYYSSPEWYYNNPGQGGEKGSTVTAEERTKRLLDVEVAHLPVMCQQCGHAPCEEVCPAMATMHNEEGINVQVYNRCIGTRYCGNNCPYKVRRFNYYEYSKYRFGPQGSDAPFNRVMKNVSGEMRTSSSDELSRAPLQMLLNPTVTVRSKGVMEKCNFCIQRTRDVREQEKSSGKGYDDRAPERITSACAQTCPTGAIVFGDIHDENSEVNEVARAPHGYKLLDNVLNTRPSVMYMQRIRNRPAFAAEVNDMHTPAPEPSHSAVGAAPAEGVPATVPAAPGHGEAH